VNLAVSKKKIIRLPNLMLERKRKKLILVIIATEDKISEKRNTEPSEEE
jgi:hypothetical protein